MTTNGQCDQVDSTQPRLGGPSQSRLFGGTSDGDCLGPFEFVLMMALADECCRLEHSHLVECASCERDFREYRQHIELIPPLLRSPWLQIPRTFSSGATNYRIVRPIGGGGFGRVFWVEEVFDEHSARHNRHVALKVLSRERGLDEHELDGVRLVAHEIDQGRAWDDLVRVLHINRDERWLWYVMDLADPVTPEQRTPEQYRPRTLSEDLRRARRTPEEVLDVAVATLHGLQVLHRAGISHNDIKPTNIFRVNGRWKLGDFGLACVFEQINGGGTPFFAPSKIIRGPHWDLEMLGRTLFCVVTGQQGNPEDKEAFSRFLRRPSPQCGDARLEAVRRIIVHATSGEIRERFPDADSMLRAVQAIPGAPGYVRSPVRLVLRASQTSGSRFYRASLRGCTGVVRWVAQSPKRVGAVALAASAVLLVTLFVTRAIEQSRDQRRLTEALRLLEEGETKAAIAHLEPLARRGNERAEVVLLRDFYSRGTTTNGEIRIRKPYRSGDAALFDRITVDPELAYKVALTMSDDRVRRAWLARAVELDHVKARQPYAAALYAQAIGLSKAHDESCFEIIEDAGRLG